MTRSIDSLDAFEHQGEPRNAILEMSRHLVKNAKMRGHRVYPQLFFIGPEFVAFVILDDKEYGAWGAQLEGLKPPGPLLGIALLTHSIADHVDEEGHLTQTTRGHILWMRDGQSEDGWFWEDDKDLDFHPLPEPRLDVSFLDWHVKQLTGPS